MARCDLCGTEEHDAAVLLGWTTAVERGEERAWCVPCSRRHLRAIEGKLDSDWF